MRITSIQMYYNQFSCLFIKIYRVSLLLFLLLCIGLSGCHNARYNAKPSVSATSAKHSLYKKLSKDDPYNIRYKGHYKIGKKYKIKGKTYNPRQNKNYNQVGIASWYGARYNFHGSKTANGDEYNKRLLSAAHPTLPLPSLVKVTNLKNNKSLIVMINDRGPFVHNRIIDVSEKVADILQFKQQGITKVRVRYMHQETQRFLKNLALKPQENAIASSKVINPHCSVNCYIKLVNLKYKLAIIP